MEHPSSLYFPDSECALLRHRSRYEIFPVSRELDLLNTLMMEGEQLRLLRRGCEGSLLDAPHENVGDFIDRGALPSSEKALS